MKALLVVLIVLEVFLIAYNQFSISFDDYVTIVVILLVFPIAYFTYHYLTLMAQHTAFYKTLHSAYSQESLPAVETLTKTQAYQVFESKLGTAPPAENQKEEKDDEDDSIGEVMRELEEKEGEIFGEE